MKKGAIWIYLVLFTVIFAIFIFALTRTGFSSSPSSTESFPPLLE